MRKIFSGEMPAIPELFFWGCDKAFKWTHDSFQYVVRATERGMSGPDGGLLGNATNQGFLTAWQSTGGQIHAFQKFIEHGERIVAVDRTSLRLAEETDCLASVTGDQIVTPFPCFALWLPYTPKGTLTNFIIVRFVEDIRDGKAFVPFEIGGERHETTFDADFGPEVTVGKSLIVTTIDSLNVDENGKLIKAGTGVSETSVIPLIDGQSVLDTLVEYVYPKDGDRLRELYLSSDYEMPMEHLGWDISDGEVASRAVGDLDGVRVAFMQLLNTVLGLTLTMSSYPDYVQDKIVKQRTPNPKSKKKKSKVSDLKIVEIKVPVIDDPKSVPGSTSSTDRKSHWRKGHWRRQVHGAKWKRENPDVQVVTMSDGRQAHMKWIRPLLIGAKDV